MNLAATVGARVPHRRPDAMDFLAYWNATTFTLSDINVATIRDDSGHNIDLVTPEGLTLSVAAGIHGDSVFIPSYFNIFGSNTPIGTKNTDPRLNFGNEPFAIGRWVKLEAPFQTDTTGRLLLGRWNTGQFGTAHNISYLLYYVRSTNTFGFALSSNGTAVASATKAVPVGDELGWLFIVGSYDGAALRLWVNAGSPTLTAYSSGAFAASTAYFSADYRFGPLGGDNDVSAKVTVNAYFMSGFVLPRAITQEEVEFLYNGGSRLLYSETQFA